MSSHTYNLEQSKKLLLVDTKTFNKWLEKAHIIPEQDAYDTRQKLLTYEQLVMLADLHKRPRPPSPEEETPSVAEITLAMLDKRLTTLEQLIIQRFDALGRELAEMTQMQRITPQGSQAQTKLPATTAVSRTPTRKTTTARKRAKKSRLKKLPQGLIPLTVFKTAHGISDKAAEYAVEKKKFTVVRGKWLYDGKIIMIALSRQGQHEFIEVFKERPGFHQCNHCPHTL